MVKKPCSIASLFVLITLFSHPSGGQVIEQLPSEVHWIRSRTDLVIVDVLAVHKKTGRIVSDLRKDDFTLFEDGIRQTISHFSRDHLPMSIVLVVDRAGCVDAFSERIRAATIKALSQLKAEDEVAIMTFSNAVTLAQPFTRDRNLITERILAAEPQHRSEQHYFNAAIYEASLYMKRAAHPARRRAIIVLTSLEASIDFSKRSAKEALDALLESGATVSGILVQTLGGRIEQAIRGKPTSLLRHLGLRSGSLRMFVEETGGELVGAPPEKMDMTLASIVGRLANSFSLAYTPTNLARDGRRRQVRVRLAPAVESRTGKIVLLSRRSYIMPLENAAATAP